MTDAFKAPPDLLTVRQKRGVSLQDIAEATKISASYFRAIENGEFEKLPGGIYSTSYIRQYARAIDYNEEELLEYYYRAAGIEPGPEEAVSAKRSSSLLMWFARVLG